MVSLIEEPEVVFGNVGIESHTITSPFQNNTSHAYQYEAHQGRFLYPFLIH